MKHFKRFESIILIILTLILINGIVPITNYPSESEDLYITYAQQTVWRYRMYNGKRQRRLWSITQKEWLTSWIPA